MSKDVKSNVIDKEDVVLKANVHGIGPDTAAGPHLDYIDEGSGDELDIDISGIQLRGFLSEQGKRIAAMYRHLPSFMPVRNKRSNAYDVRAAVLQTTPLYPGRWLSIPLGFHGMLNDENYVGLLLPRSGLGINFGEALRNTAGVIDWDFQNEWVACVVNNGPDTIIIEPGDRIAQVLFLPVGYPGVVELESGKFEAVSERGMDGLGSSGVK